MGNLATNYCPHCGREIPQFPTGAKSEGYCYDDCQEGEGKRISLLPSKPAAAEDDWRPAIGTRVLIVGKHPASGHVGTVTRREEWMGKLSIAVECDSGLRPGVTNPGNIKVLE